MKFTDMLGSIEISPAEHQSIALPRPSGGQRMALS